MVLTEEIKDPRDRDQVAYEHWLEHPDGAAFGWSHDRSDATLEEWIRLPVAETCFQVYLEVAYEPELEPREGTI